MRPEIQSLTVVNDEELLHQKFASRQVPSIFIVLIVIGGLVVWQVVTGRIVARIELVDSSLQALSEFINFLVSVGDRGLQLSQLCMCGLVPLDSLMFPFPSTVS
jgi:hypothetical protein